MRHLPIALSCLILSASTALYADNIPYANPGVIAPTTNITATTTGSVIGYFYSVDAGGTDYVRLVDVTSGVTSNWLFDNQTTAPGTMQDFGQVNLGDTLVFELEATGLNNAVFASDPALSDDGINHAYITSFSGGNGIPAGTYVGMEDLPNGSSDLDYNDTGFVFTNVSASPAVPEPSTLALLGTGTIAAAGALRRRWIGK